jgi:uncharacterized membrane protein
VAPTETLSSADRTARTVFARLKVSRMNKNKLPVVAGLACLLFISLIPGPLGVKLAARVSGSPPINGRRSHQASGSADEKKVDFAKDIQPIFKEHCYECHSAEKDLASLRLDSREAAFKGGDSGKVIIPGKSQDSRLVQRITGSEDGLRMPPGKPLTQSEIKLIRDWIDQGAKWPDKTGGANGSEKH